MNQEFEKYVDCWRLAYRNILGRSESCADSLVEKWRGFAQDSPEWFFHESPMYYFVAEMVPPQIVSELKQRGSHDLLGKLQSAVEMRGQSFDLNPEFDWAAAKKRVEQVFCDLGVDWRN